MVDNKHSVLFFLSVVGVFCIAVFYFVISPTTVLAFESVILTVLGSSYSFSEKYRKYRTKNRSLDVLGISSVAICLIGSITAFFLHESDSQIRKYVFCTLGVISIIYLIWDSSKENDILSCKKTVSESVIIESNSELKIITTIKK